MSWNISDYSSRWSPVVGASMILVLVGGCLGPWIKDESEETDVSRIDDLFDSPDRPKLVRDATISTGMEPIKIESIGMINGLFKTGGIPEPSRQRDTILSEMQTRNIKDPNLFLDSDETAMVSVQGLLPPGISKGDSIDLFVRISSRDTSTSLRGGWLMPVRLREVRLLQNQIRSSDVLAEGGGNLLLRCAYEEGDDDSFQHEGVIPSGGVCVKSRPVGLVIRPTFQHAIISAQIAGDINRRFFFFDGTRRRGIANAKEDDFIEVSVHPTYWRNIPRLMGVVKSIAIRESLDERHARIEDLKQRLTDPATAADAAMQLEAIGEEAVQPLRAAATVANPEIKFYAAEALAYMDNVDAVDPLVEVASDEPAFRYRAMLALSTLEHRLAAEGLRQLMNVPSVETRYGAFRNLRERSDQELMVPGIRVKGGYTLFHIATQADPLVVASTTRFPEIVVFGGPVNIRLTSWIRVEGSGIMLRGDDRGQLRISRFRVGKEDLRSTVPPTVSGLVKGIADVEGNYSDMVEVLRMVHAKDAMQASFAIDPLPQTRRTYHREDSVSDGSQRIEPENIDLADEPPTPRWWDIRTWGPENSEEEK